MYYIATAQRRCCKSREDKTDSSIANLLRCACRFSLSRTCETNTHKSLYNTNASVRYIRLTLFVQFLHCYSTSICVYVYARIVWRNGKFVFNSVFASPASLGSKINGVGRGLRRRLYYTVGLSGGARHTEKLVRIVYIGTVAGT